MWVKHRHKAGRAAGVSMGFDDLQLEFGVLDRD